MRILVAGGGGFVGRELLKKLSGHELIVPSRDPEKLRLSGIKGEFPPFPGDLERFTAEAAPEAVVNLLGIIRETPGATFRSVHVEYTRQLLAGAARAGAGKFVQMSAMGAAPDAESEYHRTKFIAEELVRGSRLPYAIFRPSYITGAGQGLRAELRKLAPWAPFFAAPSDVLVAPLPAESVAACLARAAVDPALRDETFELAGGETLTFRELLSRELAAAGVKRRVIGVPRKMFFPLLPIFSLLPTPPMTREQYRMTASPNLPSGRFRGMKDLL